LISAVVEPVVQAAAQHQMSPPHEKNRTRAGLGAALIVLCIYAAAWSEVVLGDTFGDLLSAFLHAPLHPPVGLVIWTAAAALGLVWLWVGVRGGRGPRDKMETFWAAVRAALFASALVWRWDIPYDLKGWEILINLVLRGLCLALLAEAAMHLLLTLRGNGGNAAGLVAGQIERSSILWRTGRPRKF
jgi:hypothetical protein